jgi:hypothetical protein
MEHIIDGILEIATQLKSKQKEDIQLNFIIKDSVLYAIDRETGFSVGIAQKNNSESIRWSPMGPAFEVVLNILNRHNNKSIHPMQSIEDRDLELVTTIKEEFKI